MIVNISDIFDRLDDMLSAINKLYDYSEFIDDDYYDDYIRDLGLLEEALTKAENTTKQVQEDLKEIIT